MRTLSVLLFAALAGCNFKYHAVPGAPLPFASVDYTVLGETSAEACGKYIFGIDFGHLFRDQEGGTGGGGGDSVVALLAGFLPSGSAEVSRALYDAIDKMPQATNLYAPKTHTTVTGFAPMGKPIFGQLCAAVTALGVKLGKGPVPNAN